MLNERFPDKQSKCESMTENVTYMNGNTHIVTTLNLGPVT